jgi:hypothetical protein
MACLSVLAAPTCWPTLRPQWTQQGRRACSSATAPSHVSKSSSSSYISFAASVAASAAAVMGPAHGPSLQNGWVQTAFAAATAPMAARHVGLQDSSSCTCADHACCCCAVSTHLINDGRGRAAHIVVHVAATARGYGIRNYRSFAAAHAALVCIFVGQEPVIQF